MGKYKITLTWLQISNKEIKIYQNLFFVFDEANKSFLTVGKNIIIVDEIFSTSAKIA